MRPNKKYMLPGVGYMADISSPVSADGRVDDDPPPNRSSIACKRMAVEPDINNGVHSSDDEDEPIIVGLPSHRANKPISYASMRTSCRRWKDKAAMMKQELEDVKKEHENNFK
jgi:hypothetical protein